MNATTDNTLDAAVNSILATEPEDKAEQAPVDEQPEAESVEVEETTAETDAAEDEAPVTDEADEDTEQDAPATYTVKVDGKEVAVTLDELVRGYSGQAYIQKGMQEVAEAKRQTQEFSRTLQEQQAAILALAQEMQTQGIVQAPHPPDPELVKTDPFGYVEAKARYDQQVVQYQRQQAQFQALSAQQAQQAEMQRQETLAEQARILKERVPEFADAKKAGELQRKLWTFGKEAYGLTDAELSSITDARVVLALHDAMRYRELRAGTAPVKKTEPPKTVKPAAHRPEQGRAADKVRARMKSTGSVDDVAAFLLQKG